MNENIINLFGAARISSGVEPEQDAIPNITTTTEVVLKMSATEGVAVEKNDYNDDDGTSAAYHEIMNEEYEKNDVRIAAIGNVDSGKSTLIGILTNASLDDGRGAARALVMKHRHELENGRTSAVTVEIMGYKGNMKHSRTYGMFTIDVLLLAKSIFCGKCTCVCFPTTVLISLQFPLSTHTHHRRRPGAGDGSQPHAAVDGGDGAQ